MKKIPTLFIREFKDHKVVGISDQITPGLEEVLLRGKPTVKLDGTCCAVINGELYKRYDAKKGKQPPEGAIPCCDPDPITGHWPHWVKVDENRPEDKWHVKAWKERKQPMPDGTYELIGKHFQGNPYGFEEPIDIFVPHGTAVVTLPSRTFEGIREFLSIAPDEGLVFWMDGEPKCKIKRSDFGFMWPLDPGDFSHMGNYCTAMQKKWREENDAR